LVFTPVRRQRPGGASTAGAGDQHETRPAERVDRRAVAQHGALCPGQRLCLRSARGQASIEAS
jgi:hypothetical protein